MLGPPLADKTMDGLPRPDPMTSSSRTIAACALMVLLAIGALSFRNMIRDEEDRGLVTHTLLVVEKLQAIRIDITQAETATGLPAHRAG